MTASSFNPAYTTAAETVSALRVKKISSKELLNLTLQRIDLYNPKLNAVCWQDRERATARARDADDALALRT
jgi:Asp-tRNA(Asn)/Glu-tRNA(Gln) amidotransferase A subunit family amidase